VGTRTRVSLVDQEPRSIPAKRGASVGPRKWRAIKKENGTHWRAPGGGVAAHCRTHGLKLRLLSRGMRQAVGSFSEFWRRFYPLKHYTGPMRGYCHEVLRRAWSRARKRARWQHLRAKGHQTHLQREADSLNKRWKRQRSNTYGVLPRPMKPRPSLCVMHIRGKAQSGSR
jgi:hypothetical protein